MKKPTDKKPNLFVQLGKQKSSTKKDTKRFLDESQSSRFPRPTSAGSQALRGKRNGQGKPS